MFDKPGWISNPSCPVGLLCVWYCTQLLNCGIYTHNNISDLLCYPSTLFLPSKTTQCSSLMTLLSVWKALQSSLSSVIQAAISPSPQPSHHWNQQQTADPQQEVTLGKSRRASFCCLLELGSQRGSFCRAEVSRWAEQKPLFWGWWTVEVSLFGHFSFYCAVGSAFWRDICGLFEFPSVHSVYSLVGLSQSSSLVHSFDITNVMVCLVPERGCKRSELKNLVGCKSVWPEADFLLKLNITINEVSALSTYLIKFQTTASYHSLSLSGFSLRSVQIITFVWLSLKSGTRQATRFWISSTSHLDN